MLKAKSEVSLLVQQFILMIEKQFNVYVKTVRTDNEPEFLIPTFYASKGILHQLSCAETPQQNGRVDRKHQHLLNVGRALLFQSKLPKQFWSFAVIHATFIINRVSTPLLQSKSPYHMLYSKPPDLNVLKVFSSLCYAATLYAHRTKLDPRARKCVFLGYKPGMKGVVLLDLNDMKVFVSRDVIHHENILPYNTATTSTPWSYHTIPPPIHTLNIEPTFDHDSTVENQLLVSQDTLPTPPNSDSIDPPTITTNPTNHIAQDDIDDIDSLHDWAHLLPIWCMLMTSSDYSLFTLKKKASFTAFLVYVDDIILAGNSLEEFDKIKRVMDLEFKIKDLGELRYFLGIEVAHSQSGISIC
jgi:hypothetical protein